MGAHLSARHERLGQGLHDPSTERLARRLLGPCLAHPGAARHQLHFGIDDGDALASRQAQALEGLTEDGGVQLGHHQPGIIGEAVQQEHHVTTFQSRPLQRRYQRHPGGLLLQEAKEGQARHIEAGRMERAGGGDDPTLAIDDAHPADELQALLPPDQQLLEEFELRWLAEQAPTLRRPQQLRHPGEAGIADRKDAGHPLRHQVGTGRRALPGRLHVALVLVEQEAAQSSEEYDHAHHIEGNGDTAILAVTALD